MIYVVALLVCCFLIAYFYAMKKISILFLLFILGVSSYAQKQRVEGAIMDCAYQAFSNNGINLKANMVAYEKLLIKEQLLESNTGDSYIKLLENIANAEVKMPSKFFKEIITDASEIDFYKLPNCSIEFLTKSGNYDCARLNQFTDTALDIIVNEYENKDKIAKAFLSKLSNKDLELNYYKLLVFIFLDHFDKNSGIAFLDYDEPDNEEVSVEKEYLHLVFNSNNMIEVDGQVVDNEQLRKLVFNHEQTYLSRAAFTIKSERSTLYTEYERVMNVVLSEILKLRDLKAIELFSKSYDSLVDDQKQAIITFYPLHISEI